MNSFFPDSPGWLLLYVAVLLTAVAMHPWLGIPLLVGVSAGLLWRQPAR